jgi:hypothetical protein
MVRLRAAGEQLDVGTNKGQWRKVYGMERGTQAAGVRRPQALVSQWTVWHHLSAPSAPSSTDLQPTPYEGHNRSPTSGNGYYVASRELGVCDAWESFLRSGKAVWRRWDGPVLASLKDPDD